MNKQIQDKKPNYLALSIQIGLTVLISVLIVFAIVKAGSFTPPNPPTSPAATSYTYSDIYTRLTTNATSTAGNHAFDAVASPSSTLYDLTQIYNVIPTIDATKVATGTSYLGVSGSLLGALFNGSTSTPNNIPGGSQQYGGIDDFNNYGPPPSDRYSKTWTQCAAGDTPVSYCQTGDSGAAYKDNSTGLVWSKTMSTTTPWSLDDSNGTMTWYKANNCSETSGSVCTKLTSSKTGCEFNAGWFTPHQKQLMQAYIDGSYGNLETAGVLRNYWSATTNSNSQTSAWYVYLSDGYTRSNTKTYAYYVRCVRSAN